MANKKNYFRLETEKGTIDFLLENNEDVKLVHELTDRMCVFKTREEQEREKEEAKKQALEDLPEGFVEE